MNIRSSNLASRCSLSIEQSAQATLTPNELPRSFFDAEAGTASNFNTAKRRDRFQSRISSTKENATRLEEGAIQTATGTAKGSSDKLPTDIAPSRGSSSLATNKEPSNSGQRQDRMLRSPNLSGSSRDSGLERPTSHAIAPPASPTFRAENNARGSSPNCLEGQMDRSTSKRSSPSSPPTIKQAFSFSSEEAVRQPSRYNLGTTLLADVRTGRSHAPVITALDPRAKLQVPDAEVPSLQDLPENKHTASKTCDAQDWLPHSNKSTDAETRSLTGHWSLASVAWCLSLFPGLRPREAPLAAGKARIKWLCVSVEGANTRSAKTNIVIDLWKLVV